MEAMGCNPEEILLYLDGDLTPEEASRVRAHTAVCAACRDLLVGEQMLATELGDLKNLEMPVDFARATIRRARCDVTHAVRSPREWRRVVTISSVLSVAAFLLLWPTGTFSAVLAHLAPLRCLAYFAAGWISNTTFSLLIVLRTISRDLFEQSHLPLIAFTVLLGLLLALLAGLRVEHRRFSTAGRRSETK